MENRILMPEGNPEEVIGGGGELRTLFEPVVEGLGYELVGVEFISAGNHSVLRVYIDHDDGIDLDDCTAVSRQVSALLDVEDPIPGQYNLEVSSPGLDRPLFSLAQFEQFVGHSASVDLREKLAGRRRLNGTIEGVRDHSVVLRADEEEYVIPIGAIGKAHLVPEL